MNVYKMQELLNSRGVSSESIVQIAIENQKPYSKNLTDYDGYDALWEILNDEEVQNIVSTMLFLDEIFEDDNHVVNKYDELRDKVRQDYGLYGIDELLAETITEKYGSIAKTNYGHIDKTKPGVIGELDAAGKGTIEVVNTFVDDIVGALAASVAAVLARKK